MKQSMLSKLQLAVFKIHSGKCNVPNSKCMAECCFDEEMFGKSQTIQ